jgi:hypothetical protein
MELSVSYNKAGSKQEAFDLAKVQITPEYIAKYKVNPEITYDDSGCSMQAVGKGFTLKLIFTDSECEVHLKLSLILRALKGKILDGIERKLERHI